MKHLSWIITAAACAFAPHFVVQHATPADRALPFISLAIALVAWVHDDVAPLAAVPLLMLAEIAIGDERMRLTALGLVVAASLIPRTSNLEPRAASVLVVASLLLLRWIPAPELIGRELVLLLIALATSWVLGHTPFAVAVSVLAAFFTPAVPLRTLALPLLVLFCAMLARLLGMPRVRFALPSSIALGFVLLFFAWSGVVARAFPYFLKAPHPVAEKYTVNAALAASQSARLVVPEGARALIVSGANVPEFRRGALLGWIQPGGNAIRIGDAADWGAFRREQRFTARNPLPRDPAGLIRGYGYEAWIDGAGRVALPRGARTIVVTANAHLPVGASLQVEGFEIERR